MTKRIYLNQDDAAFMRNHPIQDMTAQGIERVVDYYANSDQLAGLAFCVNMQRALFESKVWETLIDDYDPKLGDDQPALKHSGEARGMVALKRNGVDQFKVWVERARHHGIEAFLSMRMNDAHGLENHCDFWSGHRKKHTSANFDWHATKFWHEHPEYRRAPHRFERSFESTFNYGLEVVRQHHLALIREVFDRYDMDGFEMDWMRWLFMFAPGGEAKGCEILCDFIAQVGAIRDAAQKRRGHRIQLRHRIPAEPQTCLALGYDVPAWAQLGLADQIILSTFGEAANFDFPIALWRRLLGSNVKILALIEAGLMAYPGAIARNYHFNFGSASSALQRGADGVYLFNECYRECGKPAERKLLSMMLNHIGDAKTLAKLTRRHAVTYPQVRAPGENLRTQLPIPLRNPCIGSDPGRWAENITLRITIGKKQAETRYVLCLGFTENTPMDQLRDIAVRVNTVLISSTSEPQYCDWMKATYPTDTIRQHPQAAKHFLYFEITPNAAQDDVNVVEFEPMPMDGQLEWAEIIVIPSNALEPANG